jgi:hypothetical protein
VGSQGGDVVVNAIVRLPPGITQTQSYTWVLREQFLAALEPYFSGFTIRRTDYKPILPAQLPVLGAYLLNERMTPDGDANAADIRFIHNFQIGFSVIIANNDPDIAEQKLDAAWWSMMHGLWCNAALTRFFGSGNPDDTAFEGVVLGVRRMVYGNIGKNNESPTAELQYEVNCTYRTMWDPVITDTLDKLVVTVIPDGFDPTKTQTVIVEYDLTG